MPTYTPITALPDAPVRGQGEDAFTAEADAFVAALPTMVTQINANQTFFDTIGAVDADQIAADALTAQTAASAAQAAAGLPAITGKALRPLVPNSTETGVAYSSAIQVAQLLGDTVVNATATGAVTLDLSLASHFVLTLSGNITLSLSNIPTLGSTKNDFFTVQIIQGATPYTVTWFSGITWNRSTGTFETPAANKKITYSFVSINGTAFDGFQGSGT